MRPALPIVIRPVHIRGKIFKTIKFQTVMQRPNRKLLSRVIFFLTVLAVEGRIVKAFAGAYDFEMARQSLIVFESGELLTRRSQHESSEKGFAVCD